MSYEEKLAEAKRRLGIEDVKQRRGDPEHKIQAELISLVRWGGMLAAKYPQLGMLHAIPNGGKRGKVVAAKMKREGVLAGVWDLFLPVPVAVEPRFELPDGWYHGLYLETKAPGGHLTQAQKEFKYFALDQGYAMAVYRSVEEGSKYLIEYVEGRWVQLPERAK